jgi:hypothetical protein
MNPLDRLHAALTAFRRGHHDQALRHVREYRTEHRDGPETLKRAALLIAVAVDLVRQGEPDLAAGPARRAGRIVYKGLMMRAHIFAHNFVDDAMADDEPAGSAAPTEPASGAVPATVPTARGGKVKVNLGDGRDVGAAVDQ